MQYAWIFPAACGLFAVVAILAPLPAILRQKGGLEKRTERLSGYGASFDLSPAGSAIQRIQADIEALPPLIARAQRALQTVQSAAKVLGMRRARTAVALAVLSIRALTATLRARA